MTNEMIVSNPYADAPISAAPSTLAHREQSTAIAEVKAALAIARMNPRDERAAVDRILTACQRDSLASRAIYSFPRGGSQVSGPSIRLAEEIARRWGNMQCGVRELDQGNGESTMQAFAWDVETNTKIERVFVVKHERKARGRITRLEDPRDIYEMTANQGARRLRSCILALIPGDVVDLAVEQCHRTMHANVDTSPERIAAMLAAFEGYNISRQQIEKRLGRRIDAIEPAQILSLRGIMQSLKDGMSGPADWFEVVDTPAQGKGAKAAKAAVKKAADKKSKAAMDAAPTPPPLAEIPTGPQLGASINEWIGKDVGRKKAVLSMLRDNNMDTLAAIGQCDDPDTVADVARAFSSLRNN